MIAESLADDRVWRALADPTRRAVLDVLAEGPRTTGEICARFAGLCRTAVMKHVEVLVAAGLVVVRREGRVRWNYLNPVPIGRVCDRWIDRHVRGAGRALERLREHVEREQATPVARPGREVPRCR